MLNRNDVPHRWICPFLWRYSSPSRTSFRIVAMLASSSTPFLCSPREMMCLIMSNTEPEKGQRFVTRHADITLWTSWTSGEVQLHYEDVMGKKQCVNNDRSWSKESSFSVKALTPTEQLHHQPQLILHHKGGIIRHNVWVVALAHSLNLFLHKQIKET